MKTRKKNKEESRLAFPELLRPSYCLFCHDAILGQDTSVSLIRLIDQIETPMFPVALSRFVLVVEFLRNEEISQSDFELAAPLMKAELKNPSGDVITIGEFKPSKLPAEQPWTVHRLVLDMSGGLAFKSEGKYVFSILGKTTGTDYSEVLSKALPVKKVAEPAAATG